MHTKKAFKYNDGTYYAWMGESTAYNVIHKTKNPWNASDFSAYLNEKDVLDAIPEYDGGKFVNLKIT